MWFGNCHGGLGEYGLGSICVPPLKSGTINRPDDDPCTIADRHPKG